MSLKNLSNSTLATIEYIKIGLIVKSVDKTTVK